MPQTKPTPRKKCPSCWSRDTRPSEARLLEGVLRFLQIRPFRCRNCSTRFWGFW